MALRARWRDGAGSLLTLGIRSCRCLHTNWRGRSMTQIFDHRETAGVWRLPRTLCESVGERYCDGAGSFLTLGSSTAPCVMPWRKCTCRPTRGGRVDPGCGDPDRRTGGIRLRVMARRRGAVFRPSVSSHTRTLAHMLAPLYDGTDFRPSRNGDGVAPAATHRLRECGRAMTRRRGQFADLRYPFTPTLAHKVGAGGRSMVRFWTIRKR